MIKMTNVRHILNRSAAVLRQRVREFAPYAAIELLLPGGSLLALVLWLVRRRMKKREALVPAKPMVDAMVAPIGARRNAMAA